jgi:hypothetical protein
MQAAKMGIFGMAVADPGKGNTLERLGSPR